MPSTNPKTGRGITLTAPGGWSGRIVDINWSDLAAGEIDVTHLGSANSGSFGGEEYIPAEVHNPGRIVCEVQHNPDTIPAIGGTPGTVTITHPEGATWTGTGFISGYDHTIRTREYMQGTLTIKLTGSVTVSAAA